MTHGLVEFVLVAAPKVVGGVGTVAVNVVLLRYMGPAAYGAYALCLAGITLVDSICGSAFDLGVMRLAPLYRGPDPSRSYAIEKAALMLKGVMGVALMAALAVAGRPVARAAFGSVDQGHLPALAAAAALGVLGLRSAQAHLQVDRRFTLYGGLELVHAAVKFGGIAMVLAVSARPGPGAVLAFVAAGPAAACVLAASTFGDFVWARFPDQRDATRELFRYVKWALLTYGVSTLVSRLDLILLSVLADISRVGVFSAGQTFTLIAELFGSYAAVVLGPRVVPLIRSGRFTAFFRRAQSAGVALAVITYLVWLGGREVFRTAVLPAAYARSADVITALLPGALAAMIFFPLVNPLVMFARPRFILTVECVTLPVVVPLYVYAIGAHGPLGAAWVTSGSRLVKLTLYGVMAWRWSHLPPEAIGLVPAPPETSRRLATDAV
jgi:O-antigen/teichoic acid export membrane protein